MSHYRDRYRIRFQSPTLPSSAAIDGYFDKSRRARWFANRGPCQEQLEERLADDLGGGVDVIPVSSATAGLMVALRGVVGRSGPARHVVVPSYTFIATASAIQWCGLQPLFVDVDPDTWHLDVTSVAAALESRGESIAAILACSTFGNRHEPATMRQLTDLALQAQVPLLVDSAAAYGSQRPDRSPAGCEGEVDIYSFHATKPFAIGEGGIMVTGNHDLATRLRHLVNFGIDDARDVSEVGINAKLDEWHAAVALAVHDGFDGVLSRRREMSAEMVGRLATYGFRPQSGAAMSSFQFVPLLAPSREVRSRCIDRAAERGIEFRAYYDRPLHQLTAFADSARVDKLAVTGELAEHTLSLPMYNDISTAEVAEIVDVCIAASQESGP